MKYIVLVGWVLFSISCKNTPKQVVQKTDTFYTCSMHPQIIQDIPGKCPICGMEIVAVKKSEGQLKGIVALSDQQVQLGNILTDTVGKSDISLQTILNATLTIDETKTVTINARISGRIEKLYFKTMGDYLHKGDRIYDLYSESLNNAKQEYLFALEKQKTLDNSIIDFKQLVESSRNKLLLWGMNESQVVELAKSKNNTPVTSFYSPADGYISSLESHEGDYLSEGTTICRLADLSSLWVEAQVYTSRLSHIDRKGKVNVRIPGFSNDIRGRIEFVSPDINPAERINLIRISIVNAGGQFKPGMQAYVELNNRSSNVLSLPAEAVIHTETGNIVWLQIGHNTFKSIMVQTGLEDGDMVEINAGLKQGDIVVTGGAYLLNSEYTFKHGTDPMAGHDMSHM